MESQVSSLMDEWNYVRNLKNLFAGTLSHAYIFMAIIVISIIIIVIYFSNFEGACSVNFGLSLLTRAHTHAHTYTFLYTRVRAHPLLIHTYILTYASG